MKSTRPSSTQPTPRCAAWLSAIAAGLLPLAAPAVVISFSSSDGGWTAATESGTAGNVFSWSATAGVGSTGAWSVDGTEELSIQTLTSPDYSVVANGPVTLSLDHRFNFLFIGVDDDARDGGQVRYSRNGGGWVNLSPGDFSSNGYTPDVDGIDSLSFQPGWSDTSAGNETPAYINSQASFGSFTSGDSVRIQFRGGWGNSLLGPFSDPNWVVGGLELGNAAAVPEPAAYAAAAAAALLGLVATRRLRRSPEGPKTPAAT